MTRVFLIHYEQSDTVWELNIFLHGALGLLNARNIDFIVQNVSTQAGPFALLSQTTNIPCAETEHVERMPHKPKIKITTREASLICVAG